MVKGKNTAPTTDGILGALTVSITLFGLIMAGGKYGACYNPAVGLSLGLWGVWNLSATYIKHYMYLYILGPFIGGLLAGGFHNVHQKLHEKPKKD